MTSQERIKCTKAKEQPHFTQAHAQNQNKHYKHMFTNQNKHFSNLLHTFLLSDLYTVVAPLKEDAFVWLAYWRKKRSVHTSYIAIFIACGKTVEKWDSSSWAKGSIERRSKGVGIQWVDTLFQTGLKRIQLLSKITVTSLVMSSSWNFWAKLSWKGSEPSRAEDYSHIIAKGQKYQCKGSKIQTVMCKRPIHSVPLTT